MLLEPVLKTDAMFKAFDGFTGIYFRMFPFHRHNLSPNPRRLVRFGGGRRVLQRGLWKLDCWLK
jgi:hypothetical protein